MIFRWVLFLIHKQHTNTLYYTYNTYTQTTHTCMQMYTNYIHTHHTEHTHHIHTLHKCPTGRKPCTWHICTNYIRTINCTWHLQTTHILITHIYTHIPHTHYEQTKHDYTDAEYKKNIQHWNYFFFEKAWFLWKLEGSVSSTKGQWAWTAVYLGNCELPEPECLSEMWWESAGIRGTEAPFHTQLGKRERHRPQGNEFRNLMSAMSSLWDQVDFCVDMNASVQGVIYQADQLGLHLHKP